MDFRAWRETESLAWRLDRAGTILPSTDLIIAVCALRAGAEMLTLDHHFEMIPRLHLVKW
jgi:predicted nucleic acid-binding protein